MVGKRVTTMLIIGQDKHRRGVMKLFNFPDVDLARFVDSLGTS